MSHRPDIRNVAIIAHVDHGKTTLVDQLLRQSGQFREGELRGDCILDTNPLERERGITILAKNCAIDYTDRTGRRVHINIVDTPGHADFSGEVERVLKMADGALLLVDAFDGVMPQTRYVLSKALEAGLAPIVVINKMDRPDARPEAVLHEVFDLLVDLGADDHALDFPTIYSSGRDGWATTDPSARPAAGKGDLHALFDAIIAHVPAPAGDEAAPLQALITTLDYSDYVGRIGIGRVFAGALHAGQEVVRIDRHGQSSVQRVAQLFRFDGLGRTEVERVGAGDLCAVVGLDPVDIGDTIADPDRPAALPPLSVDEPTLHMAFRINDGPFAGREGRYVTSRQLRDRLRRELQTNVALRVEERGDEFIVSGRGVLHLGILLENMRREGYELTVGRPEVIERHEGGRRLEPIERLVVDTPAETVGAVMQLLGERRAEVLAHRIVGGTAWSKDTAAQTAAPAPACEPLRGARREHRGDRAHLEFMVPARGLIGVHSRLMTATQGAAVAHHRFAMYGPYRGTIPGRINGALIASETGQATAYALDQLANRGVMFIAPGEAVYEGQVVGEHCKDNDIPVNVVRTRRLSNVRASTKDATVTLKAPRRFTLEAALEYIQEDELVELTPRSIRLRKRLLKGADRRRARRLAE